MFPRLLALLIVCFGACASGVGQGTDLLPLHTLRIDEQGRVVRLWLALFKAEKFELRVIDNATAPGVRRFANLGVAMKAEGAVAGCNGGFFNRDPFQAVGGRISEGRITEALEWNSWMKGVLVIRAGGMALEATDSFQSGQGVTGLIQSGPWLVRAGVVEVDNNNRLQAARTFVGHNGRGGWFLGLSDACTLHELASFLRGEKVRALVDVQEALNLDGGPSSGLWVKGTSHDFYRQEVWDVRDFVAVVPKKTE